MKESNERRYERLQRLFHEPARLSILSMLGGESEGMSFPELKDALGMTDGNLNRHVKTLADAGVLRVTKAFVGDKPRTTLSLTDEGAERFEEYLDTLSEVLAEARRARRATCTGVNARLVTT